MPATNHETVSDQRVENAPFGILLENVRHQAPLREAITRAYREPETSCVPKLIDQARLDSAIAEKTRVLASTLVESLRRKSTGSGVEGLIQEFALSSQEGVALMCLAEALLRIPDRATRDALVRDKITKGDWHSHLGQAQSVFVNAATWGLLITGKLVATNSESSLSSAVTRLIARGGEPLIRKGLDMAMRLMGEQFVTGETIAKALANSRKHEANGFRYSYDMLGEAATTEEDAQRYFESYQSAIHAIGEASNDRGIYEGPGISIKLSALHPRYSRAQDSRVMCELLPRVKQLALLARKYDIGLNIDAEEADRLELSLDLLEALCFDKELAGWNGIGFVIQAYQKRCPYVIDFVLDLARRSKHRIMVRLVKGAYWDSEIKRAQVDGLAGYPVYTRKTYTDVAYLACAKKLLAAADAVYPQFATHNAYTLAAIYHLAGPNFYPGQYEFQCLHGMGEPLYEEVTARSKLNRPCRVYAPVGSHETLLAYLVRRLLENGANTSFVNRIADKSLSVADLVADPVLEAEQFIPLGKPHGRIPLPMAIYGAERANSTGFDLSNEDTLAFLAKEMAKSAKENWTAQPTFGSDTDTKRLLARVLNPANHADVVGMVSSATADDVMVALKEAEAGFATWSMTTINERADCLMRAADQMESEFPRLMGLVIREAGKSLPNAISEIREAIDFLRYYAAQIRAEFSADDHKPLGTVVCISPWNFPLAIFSGQVVAALAAGNSVIAKPAEQTALIAAQAVRILHEAGIPKPAVQLMPGDGATVGSALVDDPRVRAVMFTGSTEVARLINEKLSSRLDPDGQPIPLIAETGGQNAMIVDSSALAEQVVLDVVQSAFDSAGQRCSALRILCLQSEIADRTLKMLHGAVHELTVGNPDRLSTDIGPVIDGEARQNLEAHIDRMRKAGHRVTQVPTPMDCAAGTFVMPAIIEIDSIADLEREVFGPVLHVLRYERAELDRVLNAIRKTGYGLTLGIHSRIDETIDYIVARAHVGNIYVNRNVVGAVVGVQPFGGEGLSGTGPKAGGSLYLHRLLSRRPSGLPKSFLDQALTSNKTLSNTTEILKALRSYLQSADEPELAAACGSYIERPVTDIAALLPGPTGEHNEYRVTARGCVLCVADTVRGANRQLLAALATGNCIVLGGPIAEQVYQALDTKLRNCVSLSEWADEPISAVLHEGDSLGLKQLAGEFARRNGPIVPIQSIPANSTGREYALEQLLTERTVSVNTAAAGGNANLMTLV